jgi:hypothetical protein
VIFKKKTFWLCFLCLLASILVFGEFWGTEKKKKKKKKKKKNTPLRDYPGGSSGGSAHVREMMRQQQERHAAEYHMRYGRAPSPVPVPQRVAANGCVARG